MVNWFKLLIYLTPLIPLSFKGEGENSLLKGLRPFNLPLEYLLLLLKRLFPALPSFSK
jgi:hypothetical protein